MNSIVKFFLIGFILSATLFADAHIFVYHRFGDAKHASTNTSLAQLRYQFEYFKHNGYKVIPLQRLVKALKTHQKIDKHWVVLTIDDSYRSFYNNALPLFKEYHYPFTLFVYIEATKRHFGDFMRWSEVKEAGKYGEIALHSYGHKHLVSLSKEAIYKDTQKGYQAFEKAMGYKPLSYAYPYGEYDSDVKSVIEQFGFNAICNQNAGAITAASKVDDLVRIALTGESSLQQKLRIKSLPTAFIEPQKWPLNGILKTIHATMAKNIKSVEYYVSGYTWKRVDVHDGEVDITFNKKLKKSRSRLFLKDGFKQSSVILVKP